MEINYTTLLLVLIITIIVILIIRPIILWYYKIDESIELQKANNRLLQKLVENNTIQDNEITIRHSNKPNNSNEKSVNDPEVLKEMIDKYSKK